MKINEPYRIPYKNLYTINKYVDFPCAKHSGYIQNEKDEEIMTKEPMKLH